MNTTKNKALEPAVIEPPSQSYASIFTLLLTTSDTVVVEPAPSKLCTRN